MTHVHTSHCTRGLNIEDRLLHYLPDRPDGECWIWTGTSRRGYGLLSLPGGKQGKAHRVAYEVWVGPIPDGLTIDHVVDRGCTSTLCCNPAHLEPVTAAENLRRMWRTTRYSETCAQGHPFDMVRRVGDKVYRGCRTCARAAGRRYDLTRRPRESNCES